MFIDPKQLQAAIAQLQSAGKLPASLPRKTAELLARSLGKYSGEVSQKVLTNILADFQSKIATASSMTDPLQLRGVLADLTQYVGSEDVAGQIKFAHKISQEVASGAGGYLNQNLSPEALDEYPALELRRMFQRDVPRGFKTGAKGALIPVPGDDWPSRWEAAGGELFDGRMIALKSDEVWQNLGDGEGGYDDTLGNPFPPFAFNSGFMTVDVSRKEAVTLGLIGADEEAQPATLDFKNLFAEVTA